MNRHFEQIRNTRNIGRLDTGDASTSEEDASGSGMVFHVVT